MKERIRHLAMLVVVMAMALCTVSCSDDDDDDNGGGGTLGSIVGTWRYTFSTGYVDYVFNSNGMGMEREYDTVDGGWHSPHAFYYTNDSISGSMNVSYDDGYDEVYTVEWISSSLVRLIPRYDSETMVLTRQ